MVNRAFKNPKILNYLSTPERPARVGNRFCLSFKLHLFLSLDVDSVLIPSVNIDIKSFARTCARKIPTQSSNNKSVLPLQKQDGGPFRSSGWDFCCNVASNDAKWWMGESTASSGRKGELISRSFFLAASRPRNIVRIYEANLDWRSSRSRFFSRIKVKILVAFDRHTMTVFLQKWWHYHQPTVSEGRRKKRKLRVGLKLASGV